MRATVSQLAQKTNAKQACDRLAYPRSSYYYMYTIPSASLRTSLDIFSRYVVGYMITTRELAALARQLVANSCAKQGIEPEQLILHADRGSSMTSKTLALLLADLGVGKSHSRPYTSDDNPFSEAQWGSPGLIDTDNGHTANFCF